MEDLKQEIWAAGDHATEQPNGSSTQNQLLTVTDYVVQGDRTFKLG
jgi:hypothetical protein